MDSHPHSEAPDPQRPTPPAVDGPLASLGRRLSIKDELLLATLPTSAVLIVLATVEALSHQRVLFASLASSAFLIYLEPEHRTNSIRSLVIAHLSAAVIGVLMDRWFGAGYYAAGAAMTITIVVLIALNAMHPPAVGTSLSFAFRPNDVGALPVFLLSLAVIVILIIVQRAVIHLLARLTANGPRSS